MPYYVNKTTEELKNKLRELNCEISDAISKRRVITYRLSKMRSTKRRIKSILYYREKYSKYDGEYYIKSDFRKRFGKPFSELDVGSKREYHRQKSAERRLKKLKKKSGSIEE